MNDAVVILTTTPPESARQIARALVERRLAPCVNILPAMQSVYRWQGEVEEAAESLLVVKSLQGQVVAIDAALRELHPYETYELLVLPVGSGNPDYLRWIAESMDS